MCMFCEIIRFLDKVSERTLKLTTIGQRRKVIVYCWADGKLLFLIPPASLIYDKGTYTKHLHKTNIFDGRNSIVITVKPCVS